MAYELTDFYAVITGASDGLGLAMSRALLEKGAAVALAARPGGKLDKAVAALQAEGLKAHALPMDVRNEHSVDEGVAWVKKNWGRIDLLVNNAGIGMGRVNPQFVDSSKPFYEIDPEGFRDMVETNFTGYFLVARGFVPMMVAGRKGRIVNVSTSLTTMVSKDHIPYGPSRAASEALSHAMSAQLKEYGITVNVLLPGGAADTGLIPAESREAFMKRVKLLSPDVMNEAILFLASPQAEGITGERIIGTEFHQWLQDKGIQIP